MFSFKSRERPQTPCGMEASQDSCQDSVEWSAMIKRSSVKKQLQVQQGYTTYSVKSGGSQPRSLGFYVAFQGRPWRSSSWKRVHKGIRCGPGSAAGARDVVVKWPDTGGEDVQEACQLEVRRATRVRQLADSFQRQLSSTSLSTPLASLRLSVEVPLLAQVSQASFPGPPHVLVEERLSGDFVQLTDAAGRSLSPDYSVLETFGHYVYHVTEGSLVIGHLQGSHHGNHSFRLVSPSLHSASQSFGPRDHGQRGVARFFRYHQCSQACRDWLKPVTSEEDKGRQLEPSAPFESEASADCNVPSSSPVTAV